MPRSLVSFWKRVATSGPTVDGREILPQELRDIADTYKAATYTAVIWCEHERWYGSHGTVFAVRLVEEGDDLAPGQIALEAQLKPNDKLLWLNDQGEKLFTSIEITPNFANTGKAYLTGLAVTDEPASLGTQELYFSKKTSKAAYFAASHELGPLRDDQPQGELNKFVALFSGLLKRFGIEETPASPQTPTESKPPMDEATAKALKALLEQLLLVAAGIQAVIEPVTEEVVDPIVDEVDDVENAVSGIVEQAAADREFARNGNADKRLANIEKLLSKAFNTVNPRQVPRVTGPAGKTKARVL
ncbi:MAG: GPO family capsid scaffolding protein [Pseudomonas veronii]|uniref:GPO family capsid scaffolding protein n=1 Tax=Pseudomonas veronii TaxID=76761 RepID=UPI003C75CEED